MSSLFDYDVVVTEKLHGTSIRLLYTSEDGLLIGSRNNTIYKNEKIINKFFDLPAFVVENKIEDVIKEKYTNYTFYGEWIGHRVQKGVKYLNSDERELRIFDIRGPDGIFLNWSEVQNICQELNFKTVPTIFVGKVTLEYLNSIINNDSIIAQENGVVDKPNIWEGVVVKPTQETLHNGNRLIAKYKSDRWKEVAYRSDKFKNLSEQKLSLLKTAEEFAKNVVTLGRVSTIVDHIVRDNDAPISITRTGEFLKEFNKDVEEEFKEVFCKLDKNTASIYKKTIASKAAYGFKQYLNN